MTNPPTDDMVNVARYAAMTYRPTPEPLEGLKVSISFGQMRAALEEALSHQGEVVKVSELRALSASWDERADGMEAKGLGDAFGSLGNIRTGLVSAYNSASEDLTALISKAEKV